MEALRRVLAEDSSIAYALVFGSTARGTAHADSDLEYGAVDADRIFDLASNDVEDLLSFCQQLARRAERG
jgi:predicted nucleotidyltransferase